MPKAVPSGERGKNGRRRLARAWIAALLATASACGGDDSPPSSVLTTAAPTATTVATPPPSPTAVTPIAVGTPGFTFLPGAELGPIVWTRGIDPATNAPSAAVATFAEEDPTIYAVLPVARLEAGVTISAAWTYNETSLDALGTQVNAAESRRGGWIEYHLTRGAEPWPAGVYAVSIAVNGEPAQSGEVRVESSDGS